MTHCTHCGRTAGPGQAFCSGCGTAVSASPAPTARSAAPLITAVIAGAVVIVAALIAGSVVLVSSSDEGVEDAGSPGVATQATADPEPFATPTATPTQRATARAATRRVGPGDVMDLPGGLFCRDLMAQGYSYVASIDYWRGHGQPNQMDADRNGVPCETVYPSGDVAAYWGTTGTPDLVPDLSADVTSLPGGLLCRDVRARGFGYADAVDYWLLTGAPDAMDADLNGIPCETVYSIADVEAYWG